MHNLIKSEVYKLFHGKELIICIAAVMLFSIIMIAFGGYENGKATLTTESREIIGLVICTLFAVSYIGKDFTAKTVHHALTSGNARSKVFAANSSVTVLLALSCCCSTIFLWALDIVRSMGGENPLHSRKCSFLSCIYWLVFCLICVLYQSPFSSAY